MRKLETTLELEQEPALGAGAHTGQQAASKKRNKKRNIWGNAIAFPIASLAASSLVVAGALAANAAGANVAAHARTRHRHHAQHTRHAAPAPASAGPPPHLRRPSLKLEAKPKPRPAQPYTMYDSTTPAAIPTHSAAAVYATGAYYAKPGQTGRLGHILWIDTTGRDYSASVLDVEPGDATPPQAASWVYHRLREHRTAVARVYTFRSEWPKVKSAVDGLPHWMKPKVHWWIADPTGRRHIVPGSSATQWRWTQHFDESSVKPGF